MTDAETILSILDGGGWELHRVPVWDVLTDEANRETAWGVKRNAPPYCDKKGDRQWAGPTALKAFERAFKALGMTMPAPAQHDPLHVANERGEGEPVAWVRRHPDGSLTTELLPNAMIEPVRKTSGGWLPLYSRPAAPKEKP